MSEFIEPVITDTNRGFWEGTAEGELRVQRCLRALTCATRRSIGARRASTRSGRGSSSPAAARS